MGILAWIIIGAIAGFIAKKVWHEHFENKILTVGLGIFGAFLGGAVSSAILGIKLNGFFHAQTWIIAIVGAIVVLGIYRWLAPKLPGKSDGGDTPEKKSRGDHSKFG